MVSFFFSNFANQIEIFINSYAFLCSIGKRGYIRQTPLYSAYKDKQSFDSKAHASLYGKRLSNVPYAFDKIIVCRHQRC